jgi:hypothetical protein
VVKATSTLGAADLAIFLTGVLTAGFAVVFLAGLVFPMEESIA